MDILVESKKIKQTMVTARVTTVGEMRDYYQECKDSGIDPATLLVVTEDGMFTVVETKEITV